MSEPATSTRADSASPPRGTSVAVVARLGGSAHALSSLLALGDALGPVLTRVVIIASDGRQGPIPGLPGFERRLVDRGLGNGAALAAGIRGALESDAPTALALADDGLTGWSAEQIARIDPYAAEVVSRLGAVAGWLDDERGELRPGALLVAASRWPRLAAELGGREPWGPRAAELARASGAPVIDLRALARLAALEVPPAAIGGELATGLTRLRDRLALGWLRLERRLTLDEVAIPAEVELGDRATLRLAGWVALAPRPERLELRVGGRRFDVPVELARPDVLARFPELPDDRSGFRIAVPLGGLDLGRNEVEIGVPGRRSRRRLGSVRVVPRRERRSPATPAATGHAGGELELAVAGFRAMAAGANAWRLEIEGELGGETGAETLTLAVDGVERLVVDPRALVALPAAPGTPSRRRFRIDEPLGAGGGPRRVALAVRRDGEIVARWSRIVEPPPPDAAVAFACAEIDRLRRAAPGFVHGALRLEGSAAGAPAGAEVALEIAGAEVAAVPVDAERGFLLVRRLPEGAIENAEGVLRAGGAELARSGSFGFVVRASPVAGQAAADLDAVRAALDPAPPALAGASSLDLLRAHHELRPAARGELEAALAGLARRAAQARPAREEPMELDRRLRVLFVAGEVPWSGHGGGVCMVHLLRQLGARHDVTLVHPVHPGAEGLSEEVRPHVREILTAPRGWRPPPAPAPFGVPERHLRTWSPELTAAIAGELGSGRFDLANFEYFSTWLHAPPRASTAELLAFYESSAFAAVAEAPARFAGEHAAAAWLHRLIGALRFETELVAGRFPRLAALTEPEARLLAPFLGDAQIAVHAIPIDVAALAARAAEAPAPDRPTFVYLGSYRHPPNREAARALIDEVAPRLQARLAGARIVLAGDRAPAELIEAARAAGVEHLGWVADVPRLLGGATAFLAPITTGAGMRVKHLEAMACGCPLVTTALGANGIAIEDGRDYLRAESAEAMVAAALRLAGDAALRRRLGEAARAVVIRDHEPAAQAERRERIWAAALAARRAAR